MHQIKIGLLDSSPLPAPAHLVRFRVSQVNRRDFFGWSHEGMIRLDGRTIPSGTVVETEARTVDPRRLCEVAFSTGPYTPDHSRLFADNYRIDPRVEALARSWADGTVRGWGQVEQIVAALRRHAVHDRQGTA